MAHELVEAMANMREQEALKLVDEMLAKGEDPNKILDLSSEAMQVVGERYQEGTYFLPELIMSGEMLKKIGEVLKPLLAAQQTSTTKLGTVVLGTVRGDIHDIGKDIVGFMLEVNGFEVLRHRHRPAGGELRTGGATSTSPRCWPSPASSRSLSTP